MKIFILICLTLIVFEIQGRVLFDDSLQNSKELKILKKEQLTPAKIKINKKILKPKGNLPSYSLAPSKGAFSIESVSKTFDDASYVLKSVHVGSFYNVSFNQVLVAIEDKKMPISGFILDGPLMGYRFSGYSTLETLSKKIIIYVDKLYSTSNEMFIVEAQITKENNVSIEPTKYISKKSKALIKKVLSSFAKSWMESKVQTQSNIFSKNVSDNSLKSSMFLAGAEGAKTITSEFETAFKKSKDIAYVGIFTKCQILFLTSPRFSHQKKTRHE